MRMRDIINNVGSTHHCASCACAAAQSSGETSMPSRRRKREGRAHRLGSCWKTSATERTMEGVRDAAPHISTAWMSAAVMPARSSACMHGCCTRASTGAASSSKVVRSMSELHHSTRKR